MCSRFYYTICIRWVNHDCLQSVICFFFENKWKGWMRDEVREHASTIDRMNRKSNEKKENNK